MTLLHLSLCVLFVVATIILLVLGGIAAADPEGRGEVIGARLWAGATACIVAAVGVWFV